MPESPFNRRPIEWKFYFSFPDNEEFPIPLNRIGHEIETMILEPQSLHLGNKLIHMLNSKIYFSH